MFTKFVAATLAIILLSSGSLLYEFATHDPGSTIYHEFIPNENNQLRVSRRRLTEEATPKLTIEEVKTAKIADEETKVKYRRSFLGGLVPKVDRENGGLPLYLKDSASQRDGSELVFFWHIPKVSFASFFLLLTL